MRSLAPHYVNEIESEFRRIKDGWYAMNRAGRISFGPFANRENCLSRIHQLERWSASSALRQRPI
jgi:hypothetical protein